MVGTLTLGITIQDILDYVGVFFSAVWPILALVGGLAIGFVVVRKVKKVAK